MMPNASMSGMQLARWLESQLDNQVHTIDDVLARARYQIFYLMILQPDSKAGLTHKLSKGYYTRTDKDEDHFLVTAEPVGTYTVQAGTYEAHTVRYYYVSIATPEITWAKVKRHSNKVLGLELFGTFGRVNYTQDEPAYGITSFFEDISMALMNAGNLGVATFDIAMYEVTNGQEGKKPVETVHVNCIDPEKSKVTMQNGKEELTAKRSPAAPRTSTTPPASANGTHHKRRATDVALQYLWLPVNLSAGVQHVLGQRGGQRDHRDFGRIEQPEGHQRHAAAGGKPPGDVDLGFSDFG